MKPANVKPWPCLTVHIGYGLEHNDKYPKFKVGYHVRILKYPGLYSLLYHWSEEVFVIKKVKSTIPLTYVIDDLKVEEIIGTFYEKDLQERSLAKLRIEKKMRKKGKKLFVKWKGYNNSFNSWINMKDIV